MLFRRRILRQEGYLLTEVRLHRKRSTGCWLKAESVVCLMLDYSSQILFVSFRWETSWSSFTSVCIKHENLEQYIGKFSSLLLSIMHSGFPFLKKLKIPGKAAPTDTSRKDEWLKQV